MPQPSTRGPLRASHNVSTGSTLQTTVRQLPPGSSGPRNTFGATLNRSRLPSTSEAYGTPAPRSSSSTRRISRASSTQNLLSTTASNGPEIISSMNKVDSYKRTVSQFGSTSSSVDNSRSIKFNQTHTSNTVPRPSSRSYISTYNSDFNTTPTTYTPLRRYSTSSQQGDSNTVVQGLKTLTLTGNNANSGNSPSDNSSSEYTSADFASSNHASSYYSTISSLKGGMTGLVNLGNTCFMNSILQCMSNCVKLRDYCLSDDYKREVNSSSKSRGELYRSFAELLRQLWKGSSSSVNPSDFKSQFQRVAPRFAGYNQQDAQEFLRYLLDGLHEDVNRVKHRPKLDPPNEEEENRMSDSEKSRLYMQRYLSRDNSIITDIFMGQLKSILTCDTCGNMSTTFDPFFDLSLPIPKRLSSVSLSDCLNAFFATEVLDSDEQPTCSKCKKKRKSSKAFRLQKFPQILVFHLKRFSGERYRTKVATQVRFPLDNLDLSQYVSDTASRGSTVYRLFGVSYHSGTVYSGHYTAICRHRPSSEWLDFNDSHVRRTSESSIVNSEAYVLFYEQQKA